LLILDESQCDAGQAWAAAENVSIRALNGADIQSLESVLPTNCQSGLLMDNVAQIRNPYLLRALHADLIARGVRMAESTEITHLLTKKGRIKGVRTEYNEVMADNVVIACGAWSATLLQELRHAVPVMPVRGQMLLFRAQPELLTHIVLQKGHYAIPRRDGRILLGSTMEDVGFDKTITDEAREVLLSVAHQMIPALANVPVERHWAGLRPGSPAGVPFISEHPAVSGLYINAGHFRNGVVMGLASAELLADIALGRPPILDPAPFILNAANVAA
jgi:glycine oxidase